jgi:hypothetical protein
MKAQDKKEFAVAMILAGDIYNKTLTPEVMTIYFDLLTDFNIGCVAEAVNKHMMDPEYGSFFPKPADIIRQIDKKNNIDGANFRPFLQNKTENSPPPEGFFEEIRKML